MNDIRMGPSQARLATTNRIRSMPQLPIILKFIHIDVLHVSILLQHAILGIFIYENATSIIYTGNDTQK